MRDGRMGGKEVEGRGWREGMRNKCIDGEGD